MTKKPAPVDLVNAITTRQLISQMLKQEKTKLQIEAALGLNSKEVRYIINRYGLEDNLRMPKLVGVK